MTKENRLTLTLENYWNQLRGDRQFPNEEEFDTSTIKHIWNSCFMVELVDIETVKFKYSYMGPDLIEAYGDDLSNEDIHVLLEPSKERMLEMLKKTIETKAPVFDESEFINANSMTIRYRKIFLPLGDEGEIKSVIGGMRWKGY